jgi:hypothetical protein
MGAITVPLAIVDVSKASVQPVANGIAPPDGDALAISLPLVFTPAAQGLLIDLTEGARKYSTVAIQGAWIDLSQSGFAMTLTVPATGQSVTAKAYSQGQYVLLVPMPVKLTAVLSGSTASPVPVTVILYNTIIGPETWSTV